jgi:hypothetical protein
VPLSFFGKILVKQSQDISKKTSPLAIHSRRVSKKVAFSGFATVGYNQQNNMSGVF